MLKVGETAMTAYIMRECMKPKHAQMHKDGVIHYHDSGFSGLTFNCLQLPLDKLLDNGFFTGHGYLRSPSNIISASTLTCIAIQSSQNDAFGGQSVPALDYYLAPYVAKSFIRNYVKYLEIKEDLYYEDNKKKIVKFIDDWVFNKSENKRLINEKGRCMIENIITDTYSELLESRANRLGHIFDGAWEYALRQTDKDTYQAMEALVHNLCTLNCLHPKQRFWVYDVQSKVWCLYSAENFHAIFKPGRFYAFSLNIKTGEMGIKLILGCRQLLKNSKPMVKVTDAVGNSDLLTFDHRYFTINDDNEALYKDSTQGLTYTIIPKTEIINKIDKNELRKLNEPTEEMWDNVYRIPITSISPQRACGVTYDIEVADYENFMLESGHIVHNSRAGGQVPFSSVNLGTDTSEEGRMITRNLFLSQESGLGAGETAIFPISIMKMKKGVTDKGSPNYDLFQLACKVSALRLFPEM